MKITKYIQPIFWVLMSFNLCLAQTEIKPADVIPPSPHVRNFLKYGETPVSNYTGTPRIDIPI